MRFAKYHGIGNDFIMIADPEDRLSLTEDQSRRLCDRRFGIGADGVIRVAPGRDGGDFFMDYANSDGSPGEMCGNGIRCLALFVRDEGLTDASELKVATRAGLKILRVDGPTVTVDMGAPIFDPDSIPVRWDGDDALHAKIELDTDVFEATCLSMGNPHAVIFVDEPNSVPVAEIGPAIEHHPMFPNLTNVEFAKVETPDLIRMRVWERGSGETLACGTGAAAVAVASRLVGGASDGSTVVLPGGELELEWAGSLGHERPVLMTGPAVKSFEGDVDLETLG
ncbi:MAG: diaminopimelate epimerase [Actinomycetota bacterium]|nr:diaminopimelate epimerase [Actinomycetota bacterium]